MLDGEPCACFPARLQLSECLHRRCAAVDALIGLLESDNHLTNIWTKKEKFP